jgi:hypothetical protein
LWQSKIIFFRIINSTSGLLTMVDTRKKISWRNRLIGSSLALNRSSAKKIIIWRLFLCLWANKNLMRFFSGSQIQVKCFKCRRWKKK